MNTSGRSVRKLSGPAHPRPARDRRVLRTRRAIALALIDLVAEKRYDAITIRELLDRADIGRSTFYAHYRGKDDLLLTSFRRMLESLDTGLDNDPPGSSRVAPVEELIRHVGEVRNFHRALARSSIVDRVYQAGTDQMSRTIARRMSGPSGRAGGGGLPPDFLAQAFAGALFALLRWWVDREAPHSPKRMDAMYHAIVRTSAGQPHS